MNTIKKFTLLSGIILGLVISLQAQVNKVSLAQTKGEFTTKSLTLAPGEYQFEIANQGVGHDVGFVIAPKGKTGAANHIKEAYVTSPVKDGSTSMTNVVSLEPGEYVYFCPLNKTDHYTLTVADEMMKKDDMMKKEEMMEKGDSAMMKDDMTKQIKLIQTKGEFKTKSLTLEAGSYQFEIANMGVGHDVGFVIAPKGQTDAAHHIKAAYVKSPVKDGSTSMTNVVELKPGSYVYFCPLNKTEQYELIVK